MVKDADEVAGAAVVYGAADGSGTDRRFPFHDKQAEAKARVPSLAPGMEWIATRIDPFAQGPADAGAELAALRETVAALVPDLVVAACPRRNWLETALAASVRAKNGSFS